VPRHSTQSKPDSLPSSSLLAPLYTARFSLTVWRVVTLRNAERISIEGAPIPVFSEPDCWKSWFQFLMWNHRPNPNDYDLIRFSKEIILSLFGSRENIIGHPEMNLACQSYSGEQRLPALFKCPKQPLAFFFFWERHHKGVSYLIHIEEKKDNLTQDDVKKIKLHRKILWSSSFDCLSSTGTWKIH